LPNVVAPDTPSGSERWILQTVQNVQTLEYENITTSTTLEVAKTYNDSSGTNTHTLPLLSGTSAGETINLYITGTDRTVIINKHATDGGTEVYTGYAIGDYVTLVSNGSAWLVKDEKVTVYGKLAKTVDESLTTSQVIDTCDSNYSEVNDIGGWWDASTNHRLNIGFDCLLEIKVYQASSVQGLELYLTPYLNGTTMQETGVSSTGQNFYESEFSDGDYIEMYMKNGTTSTITLHGDASADESHLTWKVIKRIR
jgi:hypothetical protein